MSIKTYMDHWLFFYTLYHLLLQQSNNHLYLWWHQSRGANNSVNTGDESYQHWPAVMARRINASQVLRLVSSGKGSRQRFVISFGKVLLCCICSEWVNGCTQPINYRYGLQYKTHPPQPYRARVQAHMHQYEMGLLHLQFSCCQMLI